MKQTIALWSMVMVHGLLVADSRYMSVSTRTWGRKADEARGVYSNVVDVQAGWLARPGTEAPETQFYFITHGSGAFPVPRVRTVARGERASWSIVNRTTVFWSIYIVASLILAYLALELFLI